MAKTSFLEKLRHNFSETHFRAVIAPLSSGQKMWLDIMMAVVTVLSFGVLYLSIGLTREALDLRWLSRNGLETVAEIRSLQFDSSRSGTWTNLTYAFQAADGRTYAGSARRDGNRFFRNARQVAIRYDANDPRRSAPVFDLSYEFWKRVVLGAVVLSGVLVTLLVAYRYVRVRRALAMSAA